jgi:hypothetical protein
MLVIHQLWMFGTESLPKVMLVTSPIIGLHLVLIAVVIGRLHPGRPEVDYGNAQTSSSDCERDMYPSPQRRCQIDCYGHASPSRDRHLNRDFHSSRNRDFHSSPNQDRSRDRDLTSRDGDNRRNNNDRREDRSSMNCDFQRLRRRVGNDQETSHDRLAFTFRPFPGAVGRNATLDQPRALPTQTTMARGYAASDHTT